MLKRQVWIDLIYASLLNHVRYKNHSLTFHKCQSSFEVRKDQAEIFVHTILHGLKEIACDLLG